MVEYRKIEKCDLTGVIDLCRAEGWPSFVQDSDRAWRVLTAPGVTTLVAIDSGNVVGFAQMQSDGEIQAHLSLIAVIADHRGFGIGTRLIHESFKVSGAERIDLITDSAPDFYRSFAHRSDFIGFRLYPQYNKVGD